jgi:hypothetical protein
MQSSDDYRSAYCRLLDDPDFQALSPEAQRLWFFLRFSQECGPTGLFRWYPPLTSSRMRVTEENLKRYLNELVTQDYVRLETGYILIRNALRFEPTFKPAVNSKHLVAVHRHLAALGHLQIARGLLDELGLSYPSEWLSKGYRYPSDTLSRTPGIPRTAPAPATAPATAPETVAVDGDAATTADTPSIPYPEEPELPPDGDPPAEVSEPEANAYPWHPEDERDFGEAEKPHGRWRDYVEVHMAQKTPPPWPRFLPWLKDDVQRRAQREKARNPVDPRKAREADRKEAPDAPAV